MAQNFESQEHEGPCCSSCDWEYEYTDVGMKNFGFGCCCKTEAYNDRIRNTTGRGRIT
jgi:hypothetical protein